jgi:hypothetical protein
VAYLEVYVPPLLVTGKTLILDRYPVHRARAIRAFLDRHHVRYVTCTVLTGTQSE